MTKREKIQNELFILHKEGDKLLNDFQNDDEGFIPRYEYQSWYSKSLRSIESLASDRYSEFKTYYEIDPKRTVLKPSTYVIQDYFKGVILSSLNYTNFDHRKQFVMCFRNQITILHSIIDRANSALANIENEILSELQDNEIEVARQLSEINLSAAGALAGVVLEGHLQQVIKSREIELTKNNPTISDFNESLKKASLIDVSTWRKISYLADIRNICSHRRNEEPTKEKVKELIDGVEWVTKNIF